MDINLINGHSVFSINKWAARYKPLIIYVYIYWDLDFLGYGNYKPARLLQPSLYRYPDGHNTREDHSKLQLTAFYFLGVVFWWVKANQFISEVLNLTINYKSEYIINIQSAILIVKHNHCLAAQSQFNQSRRTLPSEFRFFQPKVPSALALKLSKILIGSTSR